MGAVSDELGKSLFRIFPKMKRGAMKNMLSVHCCSHVREIHIGENNR